MLENNKKVKPSIKKKIETIITNISTLFIVQPPSNNIN